MVRVISAHHFDSQTIQTCEDASAVTIAPPSKLLVALLHHVVEVRDLSQSGEVLFTFPTIDQVDTIVHSRIGNYVATLERKKARYGSEGAYVRVYANWDCIGEKERADGNGQPIMARIAGKVTPTSSQIKRGSLEMIELPIKYSSINLLACCQSTGNLIIGSKKSITIFHVVFRTHDISRLKFLDFEPSSFNLELSFEPTSISLVEDIVAVLNSNSVHVFKITEGSDTSNSDVSKNLISKKKSMSLGSSEESVPSKSHADENSDDLSSSGAPSTLDLNVLINSVLNPQGPFEWEHVLHKNSFPVVVQFPSIPSAVGMSDSSNFKSSSFKSSHSVSKMPVTILKNTEEEGQISIENLLRLELLDMECVLDKLQCLILRPLYRTSGGEINAGSDVSYPQLRSEHYPQLVALNCLVCTHQEGFMYHFPALEGGLKFGEGKCISVYHFTSPVISVVLELNLLHALTETGLETYTLRTAHHALQVCMDVDYPPPTDPISLIGLRPFLGVVNLLLSETYLVIVASSHDTYDSPHLSSAWTLYSLQLPSTATLYTDIVALAVNHRFSGPSNYLQLLNEAHIILKAAVNIRTCHEYPQVDIEVELFKESCLMLADHLLSSDNLKDWQYATKLYNSAQVSPAQVIERIKKIEADAKDANMPISIEKGLTEYLKSSVGSWPDLSGDSPQVIAAILTDFLENSKQVHILPLLVLQHSFLREVSGEKIVNLIKELRNGIDDKNDTYHTISLALVVLYLQKGLVDEAMKNLKLCLSSREICTSLLLSNPFLLFERSKLNRVTNEKEFSSFSDLTVLLIDTDPVLFCETLLQLVERKFVDLQIVMKMFLSYLVTCTSVTQVKASQCLQYFLEYYFAKFKSTCDHDSGPVTKEALKILMRSYLSDLKLNSMDKFTDTRLSNIDNIFSDSLPPVLKMLPDSKSKFHDCPSLKKLQSLIVSGWLDKDALSELSVYVHDVLPDCLSLKILAEPENAIDLLFQLCPETLPQYAKDTFESENEWKNLVQKLYDAVNENRNTSGEDQEDKPVYLNLLKDILEHLASNLSMEEFCRILPPDFDSTFHEFIVRCQNICHANAVRALIITTSRNLLLSKGS
ncbi:unnamed protein product [Bemisia tabaci]|uniref:Hermansky-Pudlak syndrome 3 protein n=1 Tax=Bemisia tabaci TaxID=7038 RepID=A0A9P0F848_BEMTA|nr:unnamed protein product [Bemisia tabaci]